MTPSLKGIVGKSMALDGKQQVGETHPFSYCAWKCPGLWYKVAFHNIGGTIYCMTNNFMSNRNDVAVSILCN